MFFVVDYIRKKEIAKFLKGWYTIRLLSTASGPNIDLEQREKAVKGAGDIRENTSL